MDFSSQFHEIADVSRTFRLVPKKEAFPPTQMKATLFEAAHQALLLSAEHGTPVDVVGEAREVPGQNKGAVTVWATITVPKKSPLFGIVSGSDYAELADVKRLWMLIGKSADSYAAGKEGTFREAFEYILIDAGFWKTPYEAWEANPEHYRREGGLKAHWATAAVPVLSPVRNDRYFFR
jgi:hypothetical protein